MEERPVSERACGGARSGAALLISLLALFGLTLLAASGFLLATLELRISRTHVSAVRAFYAADAALADYLGADTVRLPDPVTTAGTGARVSVAARPLLRLEGRRLWSVEARAELPVPTAPARRAIGVEALGPFQLDPAAAVTALAGLRIAAATASISGRDAAAGACGGRDTAGVAVPPGGLQVDPGALSPDGSPAIGQAPSAALLPPGLDWPRLRDGLGSPPDARVPVDPWPDFAALPEDAWPYVRVEPGAGPLPADAPGRGVLLVPGDVRTEAGFRWEGLVLVGGRLVPEGELEIAGALLTGLDATTGGTPPREELTAGPLRLQLDRCALDRSGARLGPGPVVVPGSWYERQERW